MPSLGEDTIFHVCQITYLCTVCDKRDNVTMNVKIENESAWLTGSGFLDSCANKLAVVGGLVSYNKNFKQERRKIITEYHLDITVS